MGRAVFPILAVLVITPVSRATEYLSKSERQAILDRIDNACGDIWCESDFNYDFKSLNCAVESHTCVLKFEMTYFAASSESDNGEFRFTSTCTISDVQSFQSLSDQILADGNTKYEALDACFEKRQQQAYQLISSD